MTLAAGPNLKTQIVPQKEIYVTMWSAPISRKIMSCCLSDSQTGQKLTLTIDQHYAHSVASFLCPDPSGNFRPLINSCRIAIMY